MSNDSVPMWAFSAVMILLNGLLGLMILRLWKSVDENTSALTSLAIALPTNYVTKLDVDRHNQMDVEHHQHADATSKELVHLVHALDIRLTAIDGDVRAAQAGLRDAR